MARFHLRRWIALLCIAALLLASAAPATLVPFLLFLELLAILAICRNAFEPRQPQSFSISLLPARAPPLP